MKAKIPFRHMDIGKCLTCGKFSYLRRRDAKRAARVLYLGRMLRTYRCGSNWHLTSSKRRWW